MAAAVAAEVGDDGAAGFGPLGALAATGNAARKATGNAPEFSGRFEGDELFAGTLNDDGWLLRATRPWNGDGAGIDACLFGVAHDEVSTFGGNFCGGAGDMFGAHEHLAIGVESDGFQVVAGNTGRDAP